MKHRLNSAFYAQLPQPIAAFIREWAKKSRKAHVSVENRAQICIEEDARYMAFSADCTKQQSARAAGEWAGPAGLLPCAVCSIPPGCTLIETGYFLGKPFLHVFHNGAMPEAGRIEQLPALAAADPELNG